MQTSKKASLKMVLFTFLTDSAALLASRRTQMLAIEPKNSLSSAYPPSPL
jgi:hypothetical protein